MKKLLNVLFITSEDAYAILDGENVVIKKQEQVVGRFPLHTLQGIISFSYAGATPALLGACVKRNINFVFCSPRSRFLARVTGESHGNVLLRREQYRIADDENASCRIARNFIFGKISNARWSLKRTLRDHAMRINMEKFTHTTEQLKGILQQILNVQEMESLRGFEGSAASIYFDCFDEMILANKEDFYFHGRNRRPPLDNVNALLSFVYMLLGAECASALETVGLDSYVGFMHRDRPGRTSLALDLLEELRPCLTDRFVLTLINNRIIKAKDFLKQENGSVLLTKEGRSAVLQQWQKQKSEIIVHPFLKEKVARGLVPYVQALLLSRYIRGDLDEYPPFLWKG